ncbi:hypothetical protein [Dactylosporangium sp. CA-139066]|uniref:hypothetical protein n=1 Tax=Dactylosporangium sp. CA-139066 TaxID=3239930 RepID=UPI003D90342E
MSVQLIRLAAASKPSPAALRVKAARDIPRADSAVGFDPADCDVVEPDSGGGGRA